ncbi:SDR family NAD(P)-dependent oxidoreductase [Desertimonas flava]|jgi:NAD(P)-dependent dehydrogenase (short-subunit alcohol dehydrogenase family)|uniref:SDR family NAD(P)-dependent oxidoreductase n=1 Tax=Desertimonas flava TaxID=2064846 RepID=UPI000E347366|nr:SDR family oxidoreductase [Desertimonas flava]
MNIDLAGKVALVTGGSRGLGREMVLALAGAGADVVISSRKLDACEELAAIVEDKTGRRALAIAAHMGRWDDVDRLAAESLAAFGHVDVLINNAGMAPLYPRLSAVTEDLFDKVIGVNLKGPFRLGALVGEQMQAAGGGAIINISSIGADHPTMTDLPYAAAKAGLNSLTRGFAVSFGPTVRSNGIMVGPFLTDISKAWDVESFEAHARRRFPLQRLGRPSEIVGTALYLASDESSFTTGAVITVDGGVSVSSPFPIKD